MRPLHSSLILSMTLIAAPLSADDTKGDTPAAADKAAAPSGDAWSKSLDDRTKRGTLQDQYQFVRGDTGRWNDEAQLELAPPIELKPARMPLDDWFEQTMAKKWRATSENNQWLLYRTAQLNDNDRVWVERIERRGNEFTVTLNLAEWQGRYSKNFTGYHVFGVNLGKLPPGTYKAKWVVRPLEFNRFEDPGRPQDNWPKDERAGDGEPAKLTAEFTVVAAAG